MQKTTFAATVIAVHPTAPSNSDTHCETGVRWSSFARAHFFFYVKVVRRFVKYPRPASSFGPRTTLTGGARHAGTAEVAWGGCSYLNSQYRIPNDLVKNTHPRHTSATMRHNSSGLLYTVGARVPRPWGRVEAASTGVQPPRRERLRARICSGRRRTPGPPSSRAPSPASPRTCGRAAPLSE